MLQNGTGKIRKWAVSGTKYSKHIHKYCFFIGAIEKNKDKHKKGKERAG